MCSLLVTGLCLRHFLFGVSEIYIFNVHNKKKMSFHEYCHVDSFFPICIKKISVRMFIQDWYVAPDCCCMLLDMNCIFFSSISGMSDGQTKFIREGDNGVAYAWNLREQKWDKVIYNSILTTISTVRFMVLLAMQH